MSTTDTEPADLEAAISTLAANADLLSRTSSRDLADLLARVRLDTWAVAPDWHRQSCDAKGLEPHSAAGAEELMSGPVMFARLAQVYERSLRRPLTDFGESRVPVVPASWDERLIFTGVRAEVWRGENLAPTPPPGVTLVLGAGNVSSLTPRDVLHHLVVERRVVLVKANPVNDYLTSWWERALAAFVELGVVRFVRGGAAVGERALADPRVSAVHVTGSATTAERIRSRLRPGTVFTSELGSVTPVILVPGHWRPREMRYQVDHVATMLVNNAGCNCLTPRVLVLSSAWAQRGEFLRLLAARLATLGPRPAFYPGVRERHADFLTTHPNATLVGVTSANGLPWTMVEGARPDDEDPAYREEFFCPGVVVTTIDEADPARFLVAAREFVNTRLWGSLATTLLIDPRTRRELGVDDEVRRTIESLRYGVVSVNLFHGLGIGLGSTTWGAAPSGDGREGRGVVGNGLLVSKAVRSVLEGPFVTPWTPAWFITRTRSEAIAWRFLSWLTRRRWRDLVWLVALVVLPG